MLEKLFGGDPQRQGSLAAIAQILQAAGPSKTPRGLYQILGSGLAAGEEATQRAMESQQQQQFNALRTRGLEADLAAQTRALEESERLKKFYAGESAPPAAAGAPALDAAPQSPPIGGMGRPMGMPSTGGNATQNWFERRMAEADALQSAGFVQRADAVRKEAIAFRGKAKWENVKNGDKVSPMALFEDGTRGDTVNADVARNLDFRNVGDRTVGFDPTFGNEVTSTQNGMSPEAVASNAVARANLAVSQQRLALDRQNQGRPTYNESAGGFILPPSAANPNGGIIPLVGARGPKLTEFQGKSAGFGLRAEEADRIHTGLEGKYSPAAINSKVAVSDWPIVGGALGAVTNKVALTDNDQKAEQAQRDFINAVLRQESGAAIAESEFDNARKQYFPQPGDGDAVIKQKARNRQLAIQALKTNAGPGAMSAPPADIPRDAINHLKLNPRLRDAFDAKYGAGAAASVLGR